MWEGFVAAVIFSWKALLYFVGLVFGGALSFLAIAYGISAAGIVINSVAGGKKEELKVENTPEKKEGESACAGKF